MNCCDASAAAAIAVWRVEEIAAPVWWLRLSRRRRQLHPAFRAQFRPCLWGGRVIRRPGRIDRLLVGRSCVNLPPSLWVGAHRGELRWCETCGATVPHQPPRRVTTGDFGAHTWRCLATGHHDRERAAAA
jgi:hypothetical protein